MTMRWDVTLAIIAMGLVTYLCRAGGYAVLRAVRTPPLVDALLRKLDVILSVMFRPTTAISQSRSRGPIPTRRSYLMLPDWRRRGSAVGVTKKPLVK